MDSVSQVEAFVCDLFGPQADQLARESGFVERQRNMSGSQFVRGVTLGWLHTPDARLSQLCQALARAQVQLGPSALSQRFSEKAARVLETMCARVLQGHLQVPAVDLALLKRFGAVIIEDSSQISLPAALRPRWRASGNGSQQSRAGVKLHVQWDLLSGQVQGPVLTEGLRADQHSPLREQPDCLQENVLYLCDNGYFGLTWLKSHALSDRYVLTRPRANTAFFDEVGERLDLVEIGPKAVGASLDLAVQIGVKARWSGRLLMIRVPDDVAQLRRERIERTAQRHSRQADARHLALAQWTILITNVPPEKLSTQEVVIVQRARWQIERLFRLWKEEGLLDEWRSKKPWRIVCELYGKLMGLVLQHWLLQLTCWHDPRRSLVKAGRVIRDCAWDLLAVLHGQRPLAEVVAFMQKLMGTTCRLDQRQKAPSTAQLLQGTGPGA